MPLKLNVGISRKLGLPDYGSVGASCNIEVELDSSLFNGDQATLHEKVQRAYDICSLAVQNELAHQHGGPEAAGTNGSHGAANTRSPDQNVTNRPGNGQNSAPGPRASQKQMDYLRQLAGQVEGLGVRRLSSLAERVCRKPLADLSTLDASALIDTVKAVKEGRLSLESLNGECAS